VRIIFCPILTGGSVETTRATMSDGWRGHLAWKKAIASASSNCVEVADNGESIYVRDSKDPVGPVLAFTRPEWEAFLTGVRAGDFDAQ
jgi:hypothetical protein